MSPLQLLQVCCCRLSSPLHSFHPCGFMCSEKWNSFLWFWGEGLWRKQIMSTGKSVTCIQRPLRQFLKSAFLGTVHIACETQPSPPPPRPLSDDHRPREDVLITFQGSCHFHLTQSVSAFACHGIHGYGSPCHLLKLQRDQRKRKAIFVQNVLLFLDKGFIQKRRLGIRWQIIGKGQCHGSWLRRVSDPHNRLELCWTMLANDFLWGLTSKGASHCSELSNMYMVPQIHP